MSSPQLEDGYTRIANELLERILSFGLSKRQFAVVFAVIRRTYGYQKKADDLSAFQIAKMTGIPRNHVASTIMELAAMKVVLKRDGKHANSLSINKHYEEWRSPKTGQSQNRTVASPKTGQEVVPKQDTQKKLPKENTKRDCAFDAFWLAYPRKKSKGTAERWWRTHRPNEQLQEAIMAGLKRAKTSEQWTTEGGRYIPYPTSWLNARGWEDEDAAPEEPKRWVRGA